LTPTLLHRDEDIDAPAAVLGDVWSRLTLSRARLMRSTGQTSSSCKWRELG